MSIRARLLLLVAVATLLPTLFLGLRFVADREREIASAIAGLMTDANDLALAVDEKILGTVQLHYGLSRARDLDTEDRVACSRFLSAVREEYPQYTGILTIRPDGRLFCDSLATGRNLDLRDRRYFREAVGPGAGVALEPVFGRLTGTSVLQIAYPVRTPDGTLRHVLLASLNLERLLQSRAKPGLEFLLVAQDGTVLAWLPADQRGSRKGSSLAGEPLLAFAQAHAAGGSGEVAGIDGTRQIWTTPSFRPAHASGLHILVGASRERLIAAADKRFVEDLVTLGVVAGILFIGVWMLAEVSIRRQVARIGRMASAVGRGELTARIPPPHPKGELGGLMTVLNRMAESLERQRSDIAELDQKLHQSQKMEAVGQLTGGVAHDFNNLLTVILGNAELLADRLEAHPELKRPAEMLINAAERGAALTRSLLAFARRQPLEPRAVDVNRHVLGMEDMLRRSLGEHIDIRFMPGRAVGLALVDPAQLETALLNLALNARDAMPEGGRLTIETAEAVLDSTYAADGEDVRPGNYVMIAVADSGIGMTPEILERAFEPFFTTKDVGKGTGLGLSMVYGFVKQTGGHIRIYSEPGQGSIVKLYLPRTDSPATEEGKAAQPAVASRGETILVVEDDDLVRTHVEGELKELGYAVLSAADGSEALRLLEKNSSIDLLFSDIVMPGGISGPQLAQQALKTRPRLKILYTSGYTENTVIHHGRLDPGVLLLNKPYHRRDLAAKLRAALEG